MSEEEVWKDIPGFEGRYKVSSIGRIKVLERVVKSGNGTRVISERIKEPSKNIEYPTINLSYGNGKAATTKQVHRLLAEVFIPNPSGYRYVNHIDGNKSNYKLSNLEWCTARENVLHGKSKSKYSIRKLIDINEEVLKVLKSDAKKEKVSLKAHIEGILSKKQVSVRLPDELLELIRKQSNKEKRSVNNLIEVALYEYVNRKSK